MCRKRMRGSRSVLPPLEGPPMKENPHSLGTLEQKITKIAHIGLVGAVPQIFVAFCFTLACLSFVCATAFAQTTSDNVAEREVQRRQAAMPQGEAALSRGKSAMKVKNYTLAHEEFKSAATNLPDSVMSGKAHDEAIDEFCKSGVLLAQARIKQGDKAGAEAILSEVLSDQYDPKYKGAQLLYAQLRQPGYFNRESSSTVNDKGEHKAVVRETDCAGYLALPFPQRVEQVKQWLADAEGFYQSGRYDLAMKRYSHILCVDPYNTAVRRGQERIDNTKYQYGEEAYNETRGRQLWQVESAWQQPVRKYGVVGAPAGVGTGRDVTGTALVSRKLNSIIIPPLE